LSSLSEYVRKWAKIIRRHPRTLLEWFDDAGAIKFGDSYIIIKVDGFATSRALYPWCSFRDFGFRSVSAAVSDVVAKGCRPYIYAVSIGVKPDHVSFVDDVMKGVEEAVNLYGGYIENVDTNVGLDDWIDVFIIGECVYRPIPRASKPLDKILIPRKIGLSTIAYIEYSKGRYPAFEEVRNFACRPVVNTNIVSVLERCRQGITGSIDVSDTLAEALQQLHDVSGNGVYIYENPLKILHPLAVEYSRSSNIDSIVMALASNEEYTPLLVVNPSYEDVIVQELREAGLEPIAIGFVTTLEDVLWGGRPVPKITWDYVTGSVTARL